MGILTAATVNHSMRVPDPPASHLDYMPSRLAQKPRRKRRTQRERDIIAENQRAWGRRHAAPETPEVTCPTN